MHSIVSEQGLFFMGHKYFRISTFGNLITKAQYNQQNPHILNHNFQLALCKNVISKIKISKV